MRRILFISMGILLLCTLILATLARPLLERHFEEHVHRQGALRGMDVTWGALDWDVNGLSLKNVRIRHRYGLIQIPLVELALEWLNWAEDRPHVSMISIHEPNVSIATPRKRGVVAGSGGAKRIALPRLRGIDAIRILNGRMEIHRADRRIIKMEHLLAHFEVVREGILMSGSSVFSTPWTQRAKVLVSTHWNHADSDATISVQPTTAGKPLLRGQFDDYDLAVGRIQLVLDKTNPVQSQVTLHQAMLSGSGVTGRINKVVIDGLQRGARIGLEQPSIVLARTVQETVDITRTESLASRISLDRIIMPKVLQELLNYDLTIHWSNGRLEGPRLPRLLAARGSLQKGGIHGSGVFGGGRAEFQAEWTPAFGRISYAHVTLDKVGLAPVFVSRLRRATPGRMRARQLDGLLTIDIDLLAVGDASDLRSERDYIFGGQISLEDGRIEAGGVADDPLTGINLRLSTAGSYSADTDSFHADSLAGIGQVQGQIRTSITQVQTEPHLRLQMTGRSISCQDAVDALPRESLGPYQGIKMSGKMAPNIRLVWPFYHPKKIQLHFRGLISDCTVNDLNADASAQKMVSVKGQSHKRWSDVTWLNKPFVFTVTEGTLRRKPIKVGPGTPDYVSLSALPGHVGAAAYLSEEIFFPKNRPIDPGLIARALRLNMSRGRFVYGGSTVTQQLVKNLFLSRRKTLSRKIQEILIAKRITQEVSRDRVLELYLNCIEFGPEVYGIGHAARYYFQKRASELTPRESVFLAMLKPAPKRGRWYRRGGSTPSNAYWLERTEEIMTRLVDYGHLSRVEANADRPYGLQWDKGRYLRHGMQPFPVKRPQSTEN